MATYLLDTTVIIDALNEKRGRRQMLRELVLQGHVLACSPINVAEVYAGMRPREEQTTMDLLRSLQYYPITFDVAELGGRLKREHSRRGTTLSVTDTLIAAIARHYRLILITDNVRDFPMKELSLFARPN
ncbi:MAG: type II toxin-antitoxin system VapC family toxin [Bryobacteraceae bacterium]|jgi:predicted nucleic acid-binding protein